MRKKKAGLKEGVFKLEFSGCLDMLGWRQWEEREELKTEGKSGLWLE